MVVYSNKSLELGQKFILYTPKVCVKVLKKISSGEIIKSRFSGFHYYYLYTGNGFFFGFLIAKIMLCHGGLRWCQWFNIYVFKKNLFKK